MFLKYLYMSMTAVLLSEQLWHKYTRLCWMRKLPTHSSFLT